MKSAACTWKHWLGDRGYDVYSPELRTRVMPAAPRCANGCATRATIRIASWHFEDEHT